MAAIKKSKTRRKAVKPWAKIKTAYLTSDLSVSQICLDFNVSRTCLQKRADAEGWTRTITRAELCRRSASTPQKSRTLSDTQQGALAMLVDAGMAPYKAAAALSINNGAAYRAIKKQNAYDKNRNKLLKKSVLVAETALSGKILGGDPVIDQNGAPVIDEETGLPKMKGGVTFKGADVAKIAMNLIDKESPTIKVSVNASVEFMPIDIERYR